MRRIKSTKFFMILCLSMFVMAMIVPVCMAKVMTINALSSWHKGAFETEQFLTFLKLTQEEAHQKIRTL